MNRKYDKKRAIVELIIIIFLLGNCGIIFVLDKGLIVLREGSMDICMM